MASALVLPLAFLSAIRLRYEGLDVDLLHQYAVLIIAAREILISVYRTAAARSGITVPATKAAKYKTLTQQLAVGIMLTPPVADRSRVPGNTMLWIAVVLTIGTGAHYLTTARQRAKAQLT